MLFLKYFLFLYLLAISSWEYFYRISNDALYAIFPISLSLFLIYRKKFDRGLFVVFPFVMVFVLQVLLYKIPIYFPVTFFIRVFTVYLIAKIISNDIFLVYTKTIRIIAVYSLMFYLLQHIEPIKDLMINFSGFFRNLGSDPNVVIDWPNFIVYNILPKHDSFFLFRNSGPFREPGLYVIFLNIALFINLIKNREIKSLTNLIFIVSIISTFSTTGYIVLFLIIGLYLLYISKTHTIYKVISIVFFILIIPFLISLPFIGDKIVEQSLQTDVSYSRFGAMFVHFEIIKDFPIAGLPYDNVTYSFYADNISPNGITEIFVRYGLVVGLIYYVMLFRTSLVMMKFMRIIKGRYSLFLVLTISLFSQTIGTSPVFFLLLFFPSVLNIKNFKSDKALVRFKNVDSINNIN